MATAKTHIVRIDSRKYGRRIRKAVPSTAIDDDYDAIPMGEVSAYVNCGYLTNKSIVEVQKVVVSDTDLTNDNVEICEVKYDSNGALTRTIGSRGRFLVGTTNGAATTANVRFLWRVLN